MSIAETVDRAEIEARVRRHMPLVYRAARRQWERFGCIVDYAELVGAGALALLRAAECHDEERAQFSAHARRRIHWAMKDVARRRFGRRLDHRVGSPCLGRRFGNGHRRMTVGLEDGDRVRSVLESDQAPGAAGPMEVPDDLVSDARNPEEEVARGQQLRGLRKALDRLDPPSRRLIERHYLDGERFRVIAGELGISTFAACRLHRRAIATLRRECVDAA